MVELDATGALGAVDRVGFELLRMHGIESRDVLHTGRRAWDHVAREVRMAPRTDRVVHREQRGLAPAVVNVARGTSRNVLLALLRGVVGGPGVASSTLVVAGG